ncbi:Dihydroorotase, mitochondrial [Zea mays]|uniref:dihydroorotase n=1 Tax=Zea mays TaxID=4577 RepID=A0A3L6FI78_MAIZE|nr:Dihydroorotase, mitochondrial [Zea mays]
MQAAVNTTTVGAHPHPTKSSFLRPSPPCRVYFHASPRPNLRAIAMASKSQLQEQLIITRPDDWHLHLREGGVLEAVVPHSARRVFDVMFLRSCGSARHFGRAIIMPNLKPPVTTTARAVEYREEIMRALPPGSSFEPLMTLYLTDNTSPEEIKLARKSGIIFAVKLYPAGATTNSQDGVTDIFGKCLPVLEEMVRQEMPLLVHGEVTDPHVDTFDREKVFIDKILAPLVQKLPQLKIVMEHITTMDAVNFIESCEEGQAIVSAVTNGSRRYFLGTDSAPHDKRNKECSCGCAGIYSAPVALSLYVKVFEEAGALDKLEAFTSFNGPDFYGLPRNTSKIVLRKNAWKVPATYKHSSGEIVPMFSGSTLEWFPSDQPKE